MEAEKINKTKIVLEGVNEYRESIQSISTDMKELNDSIQLVNNSMEQLTKSMKEFSKLVRQ